MLCKTFCYLLQVIKISQYNISEYLYELEGFPARSAGKESACSVGDLGLIPGLGRSHGEENGYPLQYSCLENSMDREACQAIVHEVVKSQT